MTITLQRPFRNNNIAIAHIQIKHLLDILNHTDNSTQTIWHKVIIILFSIDGLFLRAQTSFHLPSVMTSARYEDISFNKSLVISQKNEIQALQTYPS